IRALPLRHVDCDFKPWRSKPVLESIKTLETINNLPAPKFWMKVAAEQSQFEAWTAGVAASAPIKQVADIAGELSRRNPGFNGVVTPTIVNNVVIAVRIPTDGVRDLSPVRALPGLKRLDCSGTAAGKGQLADLSPLTGLP